MSNHEINSAQDKAPTNQESISAANKLLTASLDSAAGRGASQIFNEMNAGGHKKDTCLPDLTITGDSKASTRPGADLGTEPNSMPGDRDQKDGLQHK